MPTCASCGAENPASNRFCGSCGTPLPEAEPARETRKTVTVVFCDVTGSTALGEQLDPESLRQVMARYFDAVRAAIERHGGTVEKFIGDAVMAVFGVPTLHEDDALRALRAAAEMRDRLGDLNGELERDYGTTLALRTGVNTGEVVTGTAERLVTGDAVNVAARLEQAAAPGEILVGAETARLARDAIEVEELPPLGLKGKAAGVPAFRLVGVTAGAPGLARRLDAPMVGRDRERRLLLDAWERAVSERTCLLFTLLGTAGVGKSRLVADFRGRVEATVVEGRCLSYGEGITYWPVVEVVRQLPPLEELALDEPAVAGLSSLLGESAEPTTPEQIAWAFRKLLEAAAAARPLVVIFDDVHWGEPVFLDLIRHVADLSRGAPILLLCIARPELLERSPQWGGGMLNATTLLLEPLSAGETGELIGSLADAALGTHLRERIGSAAGGNPLFVEEMVAMATDGHGVDLAVPPTIQALLAARIDQLDPGERGVLARGAVEGQVFHLGAVRALAPEEPEPGSRLTSLVRKDLLRPEQSLLPAEDAYRFRHVLIRDAAYDALPKSSRADLHERFADWLEEHGRDLVERDEIVGYHVEQAFRYRTELGPVDERTAGLGRRAAEHLLAGGRTAFVRHDVAAAASLLGRAAALLPDDDPRRPYVLADLAEALFDTGEVAASLETAEEAVQAAEASGDERGAAHARLRLLSSRAMSDPTATNSELITDVLRMIDRLLELGDEMTLARAWGFLGRLQYFTGEARLAETSYARAVELTRRAGNAYYEHEVRILWAGAKRHGAAPVEETAAFVETLKEVTATSMGLEAHRLTVLAALDAMRGRFDESRAAFDAAERMEVELGLEIRRYTNATEIGRLEKLAGDVAPAIEIMRRGYDELGRLGETGFRSTLGTSLAAALVDVGRDEEAEALLVECEPISQAEDFDPQARIRATRARILARRGDFAEAERLAREALAIMEPTDYLDTKAETLLSFAEVLETAGRVDDAADALDQALALFEEKGNVVMAGQTREHLDLLRADAPA